jgi:hypothetical protein
VDPQLTPGDQGPHPRRRKLSSSGRATRDREIARRKLAGESWKSICADVGVSRSTAKRAAKEAAAVAVPPEEPLAPLGVADLEHALTLALTTVTEALARCRKIIARGGEDQVTIGAANAATRSLSALVFAAIRMGYLPEPGDEYLRRRAERMDEVWGVELARMAERAGLTDDQFERVLGRVADDARFQSGLALITTNGKEQ